MNNSSIINSKVNFLSGLFSGLSLSFILVKIYKYWRKKNINKFGNCLDSSKELPDELYDSPLVREQLKRNYEFFCEEGMKRIRGSYVIVVGIGGVGSHAVMSLIRSGVSRIRVIDYDIVTLSSLNRHAFALRSDVGKLKVRVVADYARKINPSVIIETVDDAFTMKYAEQYLLKERKGDNNNNNSHSLNFGRPDYVIDCIDDLEAKCDLLKFCDDHKLRVISSMGAGGKSDATSVRIDAFHYVQGDKLAKRLRYAYKKRFGESIPSFKTVFSNEKPKPLTELEPHQKESPEDFRVNDNERIRSLPVFASVPAIFGQTLAAVVLTDLSGQENSNLDNCEENSNLVETNKNTKKIQKTITNEEPCIGNVTVKKLYDSFKTEYCPNSNFDLVYEDLLQVATNFNFVSSVSKKSGNKVCFKKWDSEIDLTINNIVLLNKSEANKHFELKGKEALKKFYGDDTYDNINKILAEMK